MVAVLLSQYYHHLLGEQQKQQSHLLLDVIACFLLISSSLDVSYSSLLHHNRRSPSVNLPTTNTTGAEEIGVLNATAANTQPPNEASGKQEKPVFILYNYTANSGVVTQAGKKNIHNALPQSGITVPMDIPLAPQAPYFVRAPKHTLRQHNQPIPFQDEWRNDFNVAPINTTTTMPLPLPPQELPVPDFVDIFELSTTAAAAFIVNNGSTILEELGREARHLMDQHLVAEGGSGVMLFRTLNQYIHNPSDFATFWSHVLSSAQNDTTTTTTTTTNHSWHPVTDHLSCYNRKRQTLGQNGTRPGVDQVDTDVPSLTIGPHNEHSCNPHPSHQIMFYALHTASGAPVGRRGETLLRRNRDIAVPPAAWGTVRDAGGIVFERSYPHADTLVKDNNNTTALRHPSEMSWQERCGTHSQQKAREYFRTNHGITNVTFSEMDGSLTAHNLLPGYLPLHEDDISTTTEGEYEQEQLWFNRIDYGFPITLADGTTFPLDLQAFLKQQKWHETYSFLLEEGDWLVLDNRRVQHGRLPYQDVPGVPARQLLATYTTTSNHGAEPTNNIAGA